VFCEKRPVAELLLKPDLHHITCRKCGSYIIDAVSLLNFKFSEFYKERCSLAAIVKEINCRGESPLIGSAEKKNDKVLTFAKMVSMAPKSIDEKAERIVSNMQRMAERGNETMTILKHDLAFYYAKSIQEVEEIKKHLTDNNFIAISMHKSKIGEENNYKFKFFEDASLTEKGRSLIKQKY